MGTDMLFIVNFCDLLLQHKIQEWTATKRLETDRQTDSLRRATAI